MALSGGYLVLTKDQERLIGYIRFNGNLSGLKSRFTFTLWKVAFTELGGGGGGGDSLGMAGCEWCCSVLAYIGKGLSLLKKHPKSKLHVNQNQDKDVKLWTWGFVQPVGAKEKCFQFFRALLWKAAMLPKRAKLGVSCMPASLVTYQVDAGLPSALGQSTTSPMPPHLQLLNIKHRLWGTWSSSKTLGLLDHICCLSDILSDHCHFSGVIFAQQYIDFSIKSKKIATPMVQL